MKKIIFRILTAVIITAILISPARAYAAGSSSKAGVVSVSSGTLNVRSRASTSSPVLSSLGKGSYVTLISSSGSWWYVEYAEDQYGYCHANYITVVPSYAATVNTQYGSLNVRSGAGTSYQRTGSLPSGKTVIVLSASNGWSRILCNGTKTGYVYSAYLSSSSSPHFAVSLNVPSFKQTDSRWANVTIGNSGKTIAQIGCATAAIAMIESYRSGSAVYPDAMSKKLSYTSGGSVYWPDDYIPVTDSSGYLNALYNQLRQGKTVLFGAKNSYGGQHWVVITGFSGGDTLTAAGFSINDPGSNYRTNLQQFLSAYPNFYKYFYYI